MIAAMTANSSADMGMTRSRSVLDGAITSRAATSPFGRWYCRMLRWGSSGSSSMPMPSPGAPSLLHDVALSGHLTGFCGASPGVWRSWLVDVHAAQHEIGGSQDAGVPGGVAVRREVLDGAR